MKISSTDVLNSHLKPLCSRDNHVMKYEAAGSRSNTGHPASYHCGFEGCSVRYDASDGYYMLVGMPDHANPVDEPGVNTAKCPKHGWLYRRENFHREIGVDWRCSIQGCDYPNGANTKSIASKPH